VSIQGEATCSVGDKTIEMVLWLSETSFLKHLGYTCMIFDAFKSIVFPVMDVINRNADNVLYYVRKFVARSVGLCQEMFKK
jgi:hypothetical protein